MDRKTRHGIAALAVALLATAVAALSQGCASWTYGALSSGSKSDGSLSGVYSLGPFYVSAIAIDETKYWYDDRGLAEEVELVLNVLEPHAFEDAHAYPAGGHMPLENGRL